MIFTSMTTENQQENGQTEQPPRNPTTLTDLPPEIWDQITSYLPTASSVARLSQANKAFARFAEADGWKTFSRNRFPSLHPVDSPRYADTVRTLTTLSRAWDRRALLARTIEPDGGAIRAFPGGKTIERWQRPRGQTIGFTPQLDVGEELLGGSWKERKEVLAFSAGAEVCVRHTERRRSGKESVRWCTYRPQDAREGRDDVTALHLLPRELSDDSTRLVVGLANGILQTVELPNLEEEEDVSMRNFATGGLSIRGSSLLNPRSGSPGLLAANLGDARIALYPLDTDQDEIQPLDEIDLDQGSVRTSPSSTGQNILSGKRAWSVTFLSPSTLAVGTGPSLQPIEIYSLREDGFFKDSIRTIALQRDIDAKRRMSSVYTIVPLPSNPASSSTDGDIFLSGAYDGAVRLHDLRSDRAYEQMYFDSADDSPIYSLLPRGRERFLAGTSRHNLLKIFDLRLGARCYDYFDARSDSAGESPAKPKTTGFNVFLRPQTSNPAQGRSRGGFTRSRRAADSSVYSLTAASNASPYIYAGIENHVMSLALTEMLDRHPDDAYFANSAGGRKGPEKDIISLSMYEQDLRMKLRVQRSAQETKSMAGSDRKAIVDSLDERWMDAAEANGGRWQSGPV